MMFLNPLSSSVTHCLQIVLLISLAMICATLIDAQEQRTGAGDRLRGQYCRGYNPEGVPYPTPYIHGYDRSDKCRESFSKFNLTGTVNITYMGKHSYHNPCKVDCPLCDGERPTSAESAGVESYPAHFAVRDDIATCPKRESMQIYEQYMEDGVQCGPTHVCDDKCCVDHPELFPNKKRRTTTPKPTTHAPWEIPLPCEEDGFFRNPNDCHHFYRCHEVKGKFIATEYKCHPDTLVFDDQFKVCVNQEDTICEDIDPDGAERINTESLRGRS